MSTKKEKTTTIKKKDKKDETPAAPAAPAAAAAAAAPVPKVTAAKPAEPPAPVQPPVAEKKEAEKREKKEKKEESEKKENKDDDKEEKKDEPREIKRAQRATSNVFALFNQSQIQEFKEAFTMIDQNRDGIIDTNDLQAIYEQIGLSPEFQVIKSMVDEAPGPLNFTMFLGLFGDKLKGTDPENTLRDAFVMFDEEGRGKLNAEYVKDLLMNVGDQFSKEEMKQVWKEAPIESGMLDYLKFVMLMKRGKDE